MKEIINKKSNIIKLSIIILFLSTTGIYSQIDKNGGSLYSLYGVGELNYSAGSRTDGMGIMGISLYGDYSNSINPAAWTKIQSTIFTTKYTFENIRSTDGINSSKRTYGNFGGFSFSVPLNKGNGWIFDLGINNYSIVNYDSKFNGSIQNEAYTQSYSGNGGLSRLNLGFSYVIFRYFSFGAQFNYVFGNISRSLNIDFSNTQLFDTKNVIENTISGFYFNTGLIYHGFGKLFESKKFNNITLGIMVSTPSDFNSDITGRFNRSIDNTDSISISEGKLNIPLAFGVGISNEFNDRLIIAADIYFQQWDKYKNYGVHPAEIKNSMKAGIGFEYTSSKRLEDPFLSRLSFRLGASYTADYLKLNNININTLGFSAGLSMPIGNYNALDLYFRYNIKGQDSNGLIKDEVFRFGASVKIGELWFLKPSDDF